MKHTLFRESSMTEGPVLQGMLAFFLPIMLGTLLQQLYSAVDAVVLGQFVGKTALAAVGGSDIVLINLIVNFFVGLSSGASVVISQHAGAQEHVQVSRAVHTAVFLAIIVGALTMLLGTFGAPLLLPALSTPEDTLQYSKDYLVWYFAGMIPSMIYNMGSGILRALGDSRATLYFLLVSSVLNVVLDLLFVAGFHMGVAGAAIATVFAQYVAGIGITVYAGRRCREFLPGKEDRRFSRKILSEILDLSLLTCAQQSAMNFGILLIQRLVDSFGPVTMAAFAAAVKIDSFAYLPVQDFGNAFSTFIAQNYGAGDRKRTRQAFIFATKLGTVICILAAAIIAAFAEPIIGWFRADDQVIAIGRLALLYVCAVMPFMAYSTFVNQLYQCLGFKVPATVLASLRQGICYLPLIFILPHFLGLQGVQMTQPGSDLLTFFICIPFQIVFFRKHLRDNA